MNLKIKDICELLQVSEKTVYRWIKKNMIPTYRINNQYRFNKAEINDWILKNKISVSDKILALSESGIPMLLTELIERGGIFYDVKGHTVKEIIKHSINLMKIPAEVTKDAVLSSIFAREDLMPTAVGNGLAFPHSRNPILADIENESISIILLKNEIDYKAIDGIPVHTLFIILSANPKRHLEILSKLSFLCQQSDFLNLLKKHASKEKLMNYVGKTEAEWKKRIKKDKKE
jgi:PTS system nitrogen regulatory IIA component